MNSHWMINWVDDDDDDGADDDGAPRVYFLFFFPKFFCARIFIRRVSSWVDEWTGGRRVGLTMDWAAVGGWIFFWGGGEGEG